MNDLLKSKILYLSASCVLCILAYVIQSLGLFSNDVAILLYNSQFVLKGATYVKDFFETNPPLIFYLYMPAILIQKIIPADLYSIFRVYVIALVFISITCSTNLLAQIFVKKEDSLDFKVTVFILFFIFLFLPAHEFGQREHFFMILTMPYLFSAVVAAQNKKIPNLFALLIGLMAGLGFGLKPYFLFTVVFIELYFIFTRRSVFAWIRVESITCLGVLCLYLGSVFIFHKDYIKVMLPLISHLYYVSIKESWAIIFSRTSVIYCCLIWACYFIFKRQNQRELISILMLALTGMMLAFIVPRAAWYYHVMPAFGLACLLGWFYCYRIYTLLGNGMDATIKACLLAVAILYAFIVPVIYSYFSTAVSISEKNHPDYNLLAAYIHSLPEPHGIYCFSSNTTLDCFPLVEQTHSYFAGRFPFFWWLRGLRKIETATISQSLSPVIARDKNYLIDMIADDLNRYQAKLIIINKLQENALLGHHFDYISYFSKNANFRSAWQHYHYLKTIGVDQLYVRS